MIEGEVSGVPPVSTTGTGPTWRSSLVDALAGTVIGVAVCFPLFGDEPVFFLDFALGPHHPVVNPAVYGLQGGNVLSIPLGLVVSAVHAVIGAPATWLPVFVFFPVAAFALGRAAPLRLVPRLGGILLFTVNPFVFSRLYAGQVGVLLGYALLPLAVAAVVGSRRQGWRGAIPVALWVTALVACTVHYAWILAVPIALCVVWERFSRRVLAWFAASCVLVGACNCYILLANGSGNAGYTFGQADLAAFRTIGDPHYGLFLNVLGLYGFWQREATLPKSHFGPWWIVVLVLVLAVMALGLVDSWRRRRPGALHGPGLYVGAGVAAYFLSLGDQGPTGPVFRWLYFHVPLFDVMREPEKFTALTALVYALCFAWGLEALSRLRNDRWTTVLVCGASALPILYTPTQVAALTGQLRPSTLPGAWAAANRLMGSGPGMVLVLPWQRYSSFPFTDGRVVSNPLGDFFSRDTLVGDDLNLPGLYTDSTSSRSLFLEKLFAAGTEVKEMGSVLSEMGIRYVVLANAPTAASYRSWLARSPDIAEVFRSSALTVWEPTEASWAPGRRSSYAGTHVSLGALMTGRGVGPSSSPAVTRTSATGYSVAPGPSGWVEIDSPYQSGWTVGGEPAQDLPDGDIGAPVGSGPTAASFTGWPRAVVGYVFSGTVLLGVGAGGPVLRRPGRRRVAS